MCEVCKSKVYLRFSEKLKCCNCDRMGAVCRSQCSLMVLFTVFIALNLACLAYLIYHVVENSLDTSN